MIRTAFRERDNVIDCGVLKIQHDETAFTYTTLCLIQVCPLCSVRMFAFRHDSTILHKACPDHRLQTHDLCLSHASSR